ncbi:cyclase [Mycobacterium sp. E2462]|uniref:SRPBCC family protein n=1 Tax=unclassified Mycobacterium TaxID=2642494 RepID=UPI0007FC018A|nr:MULTISPECIES: SRPBCC family protein [unclassified Mycobacterium]OBG72760.1 cyclase [Mycobacterium sp. E1214]OBH30501.1 cyclase [Mycobacterium sp. E1319]OBI11492.1 cyclase [Mycobacterium sp. E2462]
MAIQASSEIVIDAPPDVIIEALADMDAVPTWSAVHKRVEVVDKHPDGRPHHVRVSIAVTGIHDTELLEYHWGPDWMVWDARRTAQQHGQHGEYNLNPVGDGRTRVRFTITVEPAAPLPEFWVSRARKKILRAALDGLRQRVMQGYGPAS